jgi:ribosomal protein S18 acetylase RimI-like enzyme
MPASATIRRATEADLPALVRLDYSYATDRLLHLVRKGRPPQQTFRFQWETQSAPRRPGYQYDVDTLRGALESAPLFDVAEVQGRTVGLVILLIHGLGDAGEVTDLGVHLPYRRRGIGAALLDRALQFARPQRLPTVWVEPQNDNAEAIEFYIARGFRLAGFNDLMRSTRADDLERITLFLAKDLP